MAFRLTVLDHQGAFISSGYSDDASFEVLPTGALRIVFGDGSSTLYGPGRWHRVDAPPPPSIRT